MVKVLVCSTRILEKVMGPPLHGLVHSAFAAAANLSFADGSQLSMNASNNYPTPQRREKAGLGRARPAQPGLLSSLRSGVERETSGIAHKGEKPFGQIGEEMWEEKGLLLPNGFLLSAGAGEFPFDRLEPGMPVLLGAGWLLFEAIGCSLDFMSCARWDPRVNRPAELDEGLVRANALWLTEHWHAEDLEGTRELEPRAGESIFALAGRLCGRGPGLTPGGDDFLLGWLAAGWLLYGPRPDFLAAGQYIAQLAHTRTHLLSQCWLTCAAAGDVARPVGDLLEALTTRERESLGRAARTVLALGATSGAELLRGILYCLTQEPASTLQP